MTTDTTPAAIEALLKDADVSDAPRWLSYSDAQSWASGYNDAVSEFMPISAERDAALTELAALRKEVERLRGLAGYVLQDDLHNRLTPRVVDITYSAFMLGRSCKNKDGGGRYGWRPCDWFNDTKPMVMVQIAKISASITAEPLGHGVTADDFGGEA